MNMGGLGRGAPKPMTAASPSNLLGTTTDTIQKAQKAGKIKKLKLKVSFKDKKGA